MPRVSLKEQQQKLREDVIIGAATALLAEKGYDLMTVDEVAAYVGIAKASLYKHFESKEQLAAAAMVRLLERALEVARGQPPEAPPLDKLKAVLRWALQEHLRGQMPTLPSTRSALRHALVRHKPCMDRLLELSDLLGGWIEAARHGGRLSAAIPSEVVLNTLFARACDPVVDDLKLGGNYSDAQIVELLLTTCFSGLAAR